MTQELVKRSKHLAASQAKKMLARKKVMQMARVTRVFLDLSLPGADSTTKVETDSIMHMEESRPRVQSMKKKRALHSWGRGRVLTLKELQSAKFL